MRRIVNPKQTCLFDSFDPVLTDQTRKRLLNGWSGIFRHVILELLPVEAIAGHFHPGMGRPTKELYSMAGLMLIMEFMDWTKDQALDAYCFHMDVHYALNLEPVAQELSIRTLERYIALFEEDALAQKILHEVTTHLVDLLALRIDQQRLDSTHVFSDMAQFGRTRLMGVAIKRFLSQVKRHAPQDYQALDETLRRRYAPSEHQLFADTAKGTDLSAVTAQAEARRMFQPVIFRYRTRKTPGAPRTRTRPIPSRRFKPLLVPSIPARSRYRCRKASVASSRRRPANRRWLAVCSR